jgi:serine/threonine-protein kinase
MGSVLRARDRKLDREVAVKLLPARLAQSAEGRERFEREARALAKLSHPHIVQIHDFGEDEGQPYLVMELVAGQPLSALVPLPAERATAIALQLCEALSYAHAKGIIHRDLKPENVLVAAGDHAKLADFGIARSEIEGQRDLTGSNLAVGTPDYLAPEVLDGQPADARADIYALGVTLYRAISGRAPVGDFAPLPGGLDRVVRRALAPDPRARFQTASDFRAALAAAMPKAGEEDLPDDERFWLRGAAMLCAGSAAVAIWAGMVSLTPRVVQPGEVYPLSLIPPEHLADGRLVSRARFETFPTLGAALALAVAFAALGALRRHWRLAGLDRPQPLRPLGEAPTVLGLGIACLLTYLARRWLQAHGATTAVAYSPVVGGLLELAVLYIYFSAMLQAWRTQRSLAREPLLFVGLGLALLPPAVEFVSYLVRWTP